MSAHSEQAASKQLQCLRSAEQSFRLNAKGVVQDSQKTLASCLALVMLLPFSQGLLGLRCTARFDLVLAGLVGFHLSEVAEATTAAVTAAGKATATRMPGEM